MSVKFSLTQDKHNPLKIWFHVKNILNEPIFVKCKLNPYHKNELLKLNGFYGGEKDAPILADMGFSGHFQIDEILKSEKVDCEELINIAHCPNCNPNPTYFLKFDIELQYSKDKKTWELLPKIPYYFDFEQLAIVYAGGMGLFE